MKFVFLGKNYKNYKKLSTNAQWWIKKLKRDQEIKCAPSSKGNAVCEFLT